MRIWAKISFKSITFKWSSLFSSSRNLKKNFTSAWTIEIWMISQSRIDILYLWSQKCWNHLSWAKIFVKLNIISAFNWLWIKKEDKALIIFCTWFELFKYLVMLFNLCNEFVSFQKYINNIFHEHLNKFYTAYLNDILIYFDNELEHEIHGKLILRKL